MNKPTHRFAIAMNKYLEKENNNQPVAKILACAMESWGCFFCLFVMAFWGYLFGHVVLMDGVCQKCGG